MRKPIQIATAVMTEREDDFSFDTFYTTVLCDDGTMWEQKGGGTWYRLDAIPQDNAP